ncbi:Retrovirus-related Pol polyprotein [Thelohanellus kitauei]|uniref:Retrovirus-related Pol polyprotein n=1 Tax=Thelohanellus kitauei TaxID=669202 RepID=A0A0C2JG44_THEKT|nr:Retrovirus-related Pol polyprotein [Thelohanellus kitauei]
MKDVCDEHTCSGVITAFICSRDELLLSQDQDETIRYFKTNMRSGIKMKDLATNETYDALKLIRKGLVINNGILYRAYDSSSGIRLRFVVPEYLIPLILKNLHDDMGQLGQAKTLSHVVERFYWPSMRRDINKGCLSFESCSRRYNPQKYTKENMIKQLSKFCWERVAIDITGPLYTTETGNCYILVIQDYFSKYVISIPLQGNTPREVITKLVNDFILKLGITLTIHIDLGSQFTSHVFQNVMDHLGICNTNTIPYHSLSNGMVKHFIVTF